MTPPATSSTKLRCIIITGMAGSGKSTAIRILEDFGFNYVDNLPPRFVPELIQLNIAQKCQSLVISLNLNNNAEVAYLRTIMQQQQPEYELLPIFMLADKPTLIRRFAETRRKHPLSKERTDFSINTLKDTIDYEMEILAPIRENAHLIDTSNMLRNQLQKYLSDLLQINWQENLILTFQSFAFKRGVPIDCDFVFDARVLPNPYYDPTLRNLTGKDLPVFNFLQHSPMVAEFKNDIIAFLAKWLVKFNEKQHSYISIAIGCTGGQHRSVYLVEQLAKYFSNSYSTLIRHKEQDKN